MMRYIVRFLLMILLLVEMMNQGVSVINDFPSAEEIVARMKIEYDEAFTKLRNKR